MRRLARTSFRHRRWVLTAWLVLLFGVGGALGTVGAGYDDQFTLPDTESTQALALLQRVSSQASG